MMKWVPSSYIDVMDKTRTEKGRGCELVKWLQHKGRGFERALKS